MRYNVRLEEPVFWYAIDKIVILNNIGIEDINMDNIEDIFNFVKFFFKNLDDDHILEFGNMINEKIIILYKNIPEYTNYFKKSRASLFKIILRGEEEYNRVLNNNSKEKKILYNKDDDLVYSYYLNFMNDVRSGGIDLL